MNNIATILQLLEGYNVVEERYIHTVVFRLPTGQQVSAEVDSRAFQDLSEGLNPDRHLHKAEEPTNGQRDYTSAPSSEPVNDEAVDEFEQGMGDAPAKEPELTEEQQEALSKPVEWRGLPDEVLDPLMKRAFAALGIQEVISMGEAYQHAQNIQENLTNEDWTMLRQQEQKEQKAQSVLQQAPQQGWNPNANHGLAPPVGVPPQAPPTGQVSWSDGTPIVPGATARGPTLQADAKGNPVSNASDVDPGELFSNGDDVDEDGVPTW